MKSSQGIYWCLVLLLLATSKSRQDDHSAESIAGDLTETDYGPTGDWFKEKKLVKQLLSQQDGRQLGRPVTNQ